MAEVKAPEHKAAEHKPAEHKAPAAAPTRVFTPGATKPTGVAPHAVAHAPAHPAAHVAVHAPAAGHTAPAHAGATHSVSTAPAVSASDVRIKKAGKKIEMNGTNATGRRKKSIARVRLVPGSGKVIINGRTLEEYFASGFLRLVVNQPLTTTNVSTYDILVNVQGGGLTGQAGAIRHGIARALTKENADLKPELKKNGFLKRDPRMKERKKYGLKKARRAPQFSKR